MLLLNQEKINLKQVHTIEQYKVLAYLKKEFNLDEVNLYLIDRYTIKLVDKLNAVGYFKYNMQTKTINFYEKNRKNNRMER